MNPFQLTEFTDIGAFEFELTLDTPLPGDDDEDIMADLTVRSPESFLSATIPLTGEELRQLGDWLKAALARYYYHQQTLLNDRV